MSINTEWFRERLAHQQLSARSLAKKLGIDSAAVSLTLRGKRRMALEEANQIAEILDVPVTEVLRQAGIQVQQDAREINLLGAINGDSQLVEFDKHDQQSVLAPADVPFNGFALQIRASNNLHDRWMIYSGPRISTPDLLIDRLCVIQTEHIVLLGQLKRGYKSGLFNLVRFIQHGSGPQTLIDQGVIAAAPVLWLQPQ